MTTFKIGIIIQGIVVTTIKNMDMFLRIVLEHTLVVTTKGGWVKPHALSIWRLITSADIVQQGQRHQVVSSIKAKARKILKFLEMKWIRHPWKRKEDCCTSSEEGITSPNGASDHTSSN